jgi:hypothetical protein
VVEWRQRRRRRPTCARGRVGRWRQRRPTRVTSIAVEETSGVESVRQVLRVFWDKKRNDMG